MSDVPLHTVQGFIRQLGLNPEQVTELHITYRSVRVTRVIPLGPVEVDVLEVPEHTVKAPYSIDPAGLDQLIDAIANLEIPLRHDLALCCLLELRDARLELHEYASEIIRLWREIGRLNRQLAAMRSTIVDVRSAREQSWRDGYHTGKRDYAASITGGTPITTPNPHEVNHG